MGKSTISMAIFHIAMLVITRNNTMYGDFVWLVVWWSQVHPSEHSAIVDDKPSNRPTPKKQNVIDLQSVKAWKSWKPGGRFPGPRHSVGTGAAWVQSAKIDALVPVGLKTPFGRLLLTDSDHPKFARAHPEFTGARCCIYHQFILYTETMQWQCVINLHLLCHCSARKRVQLLWIPRSSTHHFTWLPRISALTLLLGAVFLSVCWV